MCVTINICAGFGYAWSVFQKPLISLQNWTAADVSLAFTLMMGVSALPQALAGKAQEYMQPRQVILVGGLLLSLGVLGMGYIQSLFQLYAGSLLTGLGIGVTYSGTVANIVKFFPDRRGLAAGALAAGMGAGAVILAPLTSLIILRYDVLTTFKLLGLLFLVVTCGLSRLVKTAPENYAPTGYITAVDSPLAAAVADKNWQEMLGDRMFYIMAGIFIVGATSGMMIMGHASPIAQEILHISPPAAAVIVGLVALANATGRLFWGSLSDKTGRYPIILVMYVVAGIAMLTLTKVETYSTFLPMIMAVALCYGGFMGMMASMTADEFGTRYLGVNFGIMFLTIGIAAFIGPRLAAVVRETNHGDYSPAFVIAAGLNMVGIALTVLALYWKRRRRAV